MRTGRIRDNGKIFVPKRKKLIQNGFEIRKRLENQHFRIPQRALFVNVEKTQKIGTIRVIFHQRQNTALHWNPSKL